MWPLIWFIVFLIEVAIWTYVAILHYEIKELEKIKSPAPKNIKQVPKKIEPLKEKTKREIMEG